MKSSLTLKTISLIIFLLFANSCATTSSLVQSSQPDASAQVAKASIIQRILFIEEENQLIEPGIIEQASYFIKRNTRVTASLQEGTIRIERPTYPEEVIREAIVNAVVHRDYLLSATDIELSIYSDRLEIISPVRLPNGITPERMRAGCRAARNQFLKDVMRDYVYLEHMGMDIPRKIIKGMREHNGTEPDLIEDGEQFILRLWGEKKP